MKRVSAIILLLLMIPYARLYAQKSSKKNQPNIILIFADDLGYGDIGIYGQEKIATPNIDKMAKEGMQFMSFYSGTTVCAPSRASLLTGLHSGHSPIRGNLEIMPEGQQPLPQDAKTIAMKLLENGYRTAAFGKWGLGMPTSSGNPNRKGFEEFFGYMCQRQAHDYFPEHLWHNKEKIEYPDNKTKDTIYSAAEIHQRAMDFIRRQDSENPFFLYLPYTIPHGDVIVPHDQVYWDYVKKFNEKPTDKPVKNKQNIVPEVHPHAAFATMVTKLDSYVGEVIKLIKEKGMEKNTLIIFTSDNGPHREGGADPEFFDSNNIYRGIKRDLYEGGIRVPFVAYMPAKIKPQIVKQPFALWDLFPTFLDLANVNDNAPTDGVSMKPILMGKKGQKNHDTLYWEFHEMGGRQAIRKGDWKLIHLNVKSGNTKVELYNLANDPTESNDLAAQYPDIVIELSKIIEESHQPNTIFPLLPSERQ